MLIKLVEELETLYVVDQWLNKLNEIIRNNDVIDIARARFSHACAACIEDAQKAGKTIIDSEDSERQELLHYNEDLLSNKISTEPLPEYNTTDIVDYIQALQEDVTYTPRDDSQLSIAISLLILLARPVIKLDISPITFKLFTWIHQNVYANFLQEIVDSTDEFLVQVNVKLPKVKDTNTNGLLKVNITEKDLTTPFYVYGIGDITWLQLVSSSHRFIPSYLGDIKLIENECWSYIVEEALDILEDYSNKKSNTLYNLLKEVTNG